MSEEAPRLNLYVVGVSDGDPDQWSAYANKKLVIAASEAEALEIAGWNSGGPIALVDMSKPVVLAAEPLI